MTFLSLVRVLFVLVIGIGRYNRFTKGGPEVLPLSWRTAVCSIAVPASIPELDRYDIRPHTTME